MIVMKFGGTSVGDAGRIAGVAALAVAEASPVVVVVSALGGTTDALLEAGRAAEAGATGQADALLDAIRARHLAAAVGADEIEAVEATLAEARRLLGGVALLREQTPRSRAILASVGERMSAPLVAAAIRRAGRPSQAVDARSFVTTDDQYESAEVRFEASREAARALLLPLVHDGVVPVITGFIGRAEDGATTLLGRGGSDYGNTTYRNDIKWFVRSCSLGFLNNIE